MQPKVRSIWDEYAPMVVQMGLLTPVDVPAFAMLCALIAESRSRPRSMPASRIARMESLFSRFGMDPASRARLGSQKPQRPNAFRALA